MILALLGYILSNINKKKCKNKYFDEIIWILLYICSLSMLILYIQINLLLKKCK